MKGYDYSKDNLYFATTCVHDRVCCFGEIVILGTGRDLSENEYNVSIGTGRDLSLPIKIKSLSELMGAYKTTVSKQIHLLGYTDFAWQRSFHDHIIRDDQSYNNIYDYILTNPSKWDSDKFFNQQL